MEHTTSDQLEPQQCYHCGEDCQTAEIHLEEKVFCCEGCKMVFEILNSNDLCQYYQIENQPGTSLKGRKSTQFAYLDDDDIQSTLIDFKDDYQSRITFYLPQIHCASCIWLLENLYKLNQNILSSKVNFLKKEIHLTYSHEASLRQVVELLASIGYTPEINLGDLEQEKNKVDKTLIFQLGVAGFAFGNIMLLSFPEYLGLDEISGPVFQSGFGWLNLALILPVIFYSARDYIQSAWQGIKHQHLNIDVPITLGIFALFFRSLFEILTQQGAGYLDSLAGLIFFLLIGKWFQQQTYYHLSFERDYKSYFPIAATIKRGMDLISVPVNKLEEGDTLLIRHQELIPADGLLVKGVGAIDYSFVTGEANPVNKTIGERLYAGGRQMGEAIEVTLTKKVSQSYLTQLWNDEAFLKNTQSNASVLADKVGRYFTYGILLIAFSTLFYWLLYDWTIAINAFTAVLIIACPCAVALSIPFTFGNVLRILAKQGFYLKNTSVIEGLQSVTHLVMDKTGTLTKNNDSQMIFQGDSLDELEQSLVRSLVHQSSHPVSRQIEASLSGAALLAIKNFKEHTGQGIEGNIGYHYIRIGSPHFLSQEIQTDFQAEKGTSIEIDGVIKGAFIWKSAYRKGLIPLLKKWGQQFKLYLLSGDNEQERAFLEPLFPQDSELRFNQSPQDKLAFISQLQAEEGKVLMLGDGLNDAGALKQSDVGVVVSERTSHFTPASDAILDADQFHRLDQFIAYARGSLHLIYYAYGLAFLYNVVGLSFAVTGTLSPVVAAILMPASSITIVAFGVLSSTLLAKRLEVI